MTPASGINWLWEIVSPAMVPTPLDTYCVGLICWYLLKNVFWINLTNTLFLFPVINHFHLKQCFNLTFRIIDVFGLIGLFHTMNRLSVTCLIQSCGGRGMKQLPPMWMSTDFVLLLRDCHVELSGGNRVALSNQTEVARHCGNRQNEVKEEKDNRAADCASV